MNEVFILMQRDVVKYDIIRHHATTFIAKFWNINQLESDRGKSEIIEFIFSWIIDINKAHEPYI